jgi:hypothetical protein
MLHAESPNPKVRFVNSVGRLIMNLFGPAERSPVDTPIIHKNDDEEAITQKQLADIQVERDNDGHSWAERKEHPKD